VSSWENSAVHFVLRQQTEDSCKRTEKIFADRKGTRIVRSKGQLIAPYHKKSTSRNATEGVNLADFFSPYCNGIGVSVSELGKQVHCGHQIHKTKGTDHRPNLQCKDTEEMTLRCASSSLESDPVDLVNMIPHVWVSLEAVSRINRRKK
jgi:hypothetical protein